MITIRDTSNRYAIFLAVAMGSFLMPFMITSVNIALPAIGNEFSIDAVLLNWIATSFVLASAMFIIPFGKIADIYGRKKIFSFGFIIFIIASVMSAIAGSVNLLIFSRFLQGIGAAMYYGTGIALLTSVTPMKERGKVLGTTIALVYIGQSVGPFLGGILTQYYGWRSIFYFAIPFCVLAVLLVTWKIKDDWAEAKEENLNYTSSIIYSLTFLVIMYGISVIPDRNSIWLISVGLVGFIYFIWHEAKVKNPLINIELFRENRVFAFSNLATLINYSSTYAVIFLMSLYLQYIQMLTPQNAGLILMSKAIVQGIFSPLTGSLSDRNDPKKLASIGMGITAVALFLLTFVNAQTSLVYIILVLIFLGLGLGVFVSPNTNAIMSSVEKKYYGVSSATLATTRQTGQLLSMAIVMLLFALIIGKVEITPQHYEAFLKASRTAYVIFAILCSCGIFFSLARDKGKRDSGGH